MARTSSPPTRPTRGKRASRVTGSTRQSWFVAPDAGSPGRRSRKTYLLWVPVLSAAGIGLAFVFHGNLRSSKTDQTEPQSARTASEPAEVDRMIRLPGGNYLMGDNLSNYPPERPQHNVYVGEFLVDEHEVTNRQFAEFVNKTGYQTTAERRGWAYVLDRQRGGWKKAPGADWRHPYGPHSQIDAMGEQPVVQVSWHDAVAYARWVGKRLLTEAEWEYAARGGLRDTEYTWGNELTIDRRYQANFWQGWFPSEDLKADGFDGPAPVKSFPPNGYGLFDMAGNVWEWCHDWYDPDYYASSPRSCPQGPSSGQYRVQRGGSWLSAENSFAGYRNAARSKRPPDVCYQDVGFRCVVDPEDM